METPEAYANGVRIARRRQRQIDQQNQRVLNQRILSLSPELLENLRAHALDEFKTAPAIVAIIQTADVRTCQYTRAVLMRLMDENPQPSKVDSIGERNRSNAAIINALPPATRVELLKLALATFSRGTVDFWCKPKRPGDAPNMLAPLHVPAVITRMLSMLEGAPDAGPTKEEIGAGCASDAQEFRELVAEETHVEPSKAAIARARLVPVDPAAVGLAKSLPVDVTDNEGRRKSEMIARLESIQDPEPEPTIIKDLIERLPGHHAGAR